MVFIKNGTTDWELKSEENTFTIDRYMLGKFIKVEIDSIDQENFAYSQTIIPTEPILNSVNYVEDKTYYITTESPSFTFELTSNLLNTDYNIINSPHSGFLNKINSNTYEYQWITTGRFYIDYEINSLSNIGVIELNVLGIENKNLKTYKNTNLTFDLDIEFPVIFDEPTFGHISNVASSYTYIPQQDFVGNEILKYSVRINDQIYHRKIYIQVSDLGEITIFPRGEGPYKENDLVTILFNSFEFLSDVNIVIEDNSYKMTKDLLEHEYEYTVTNETKNIGFSINTKFNGIDYKITSSFLQNNIRPDKPLIRFSNNIVYFENLSDFFINIYNEDLSNINNQFNVNGNTIRFDLLPDGTYTYYFSYISITGLESEKQESILIF